MFFRNRRFRILQVHKVDRGIDRPGKVVRIGNRNVERIADDVDRPRRHGEVDVEVPAVGAQRLMGFDENQPFDEIGKMLLDAGARRRDLVEMFVCWAETKNLFEEGLGGARHRKLVEFVNLLRLRLSRRDVNEVMQKGPRPRVARFWIGGEPHNARARRFGSRRV